MTWATALQNLNQRSIGTFAEDLTLFGGVVIKGVRDDDYRASDPGAFGLTLSASAPAFTCESKDVAELVQEDTVDIGDVRYTIRELQPDGQGHTRVILKK
jgi:hypothetical protein